MSSTGMELFDYLFAGGFTRPKGVLNDYFLKHMFHQARGTRFTKDWGNYSDNSFCDDWAVILNEVLSKEDSET